MCYWLHEYFTNQLGENNLFGLFAWMLTENDSWTYFTADDALLKDVITPGSVLLERISQELNRDDNIGVKNYIHLASKLEVPADVRREFADINECRKSPTKEVLEWVAARFPETTLSDVAKALEEILRKDAIQIISRHFPDIIGE